MNSLNHKSYKNQSFLQWKQFDPYPNDPFMIGTIKAWSRKEHMALNALVTLCNRYKDVYAAEETIANQAGCSVSSLKIYLNKWEKKGLVSKFVRGVKKTNLYKISSWFSCFNIQQLLAQILPFFYYLQQKIQSLNPENWLQCINVLRNYIKQTAYYYKKIQVPEEKKNYQRKILQRKVNYDIGKYFGTETDAANIISKSKLKAEEKKEMLQEIINDLQLTDSQINQLKQFDDAILKQAYANLKKNPNIEFKFRYILKACQAIQEKKTLLKKSNENDKLSKEEKTQVNQEALKIPHPPMPWISKSEEENLARFNDWYIQYADDYAQLMKLPKVNFSEKFMLKVNEMFHDPNNPNQIERWHENGKQFQELSVPQLFEKLEILAKTMPKEMLTNFNPTFMKVFEQTARKVVNEEIQAKEKEKEKNS
jgi:hypothetical protein